ncbi:MAG: hypothetical protein KatS3mg076_2632 [Candidatus Binatia bacterium]|nr:MAG: hypothetical protein KatS3mg076_2632 [Candidatus Binatia bacterium]
MKRVLLFSGVHGDASRLHRILREAEERKAESLLFAGGILDSKLAPEERASFLVSFFEALGKTSRFSAVIPGPGDGPLREFLRAGLNAENTFAHVFLAHASAIPHGDTVVGGLGGELSESEDRDSDPIRHSRVTSQYFLRGLLYADKPIKVLMLSDPPPGPLADGAGSPLAEELVHTLHPELCVVAGTRSHRGTQVVGDTLVVNPGKLCEGSAAWLERVPGEVEWIDL